MEALREVERRCEAFPGVAAELQHLREDTKQMHHGTAS